MADQDIKQIVKDKYGKAALRVTTGGSSCCGSSPSRGECDPITSNLYSTTETAGLPAEAAPWISSMPVWEHFLTEEETWEVILFLYDYTGRQPRSWK